MSELGEKDLIADLRRLMDDERCLCSSAHMDWRGVEDLLDRLERAEAQVRSARAVLDCRLSNHHDSCGSWRRGFACDCWRAELRDAVTPPGSTTGQTHQLDATEQREMR